MAVGSSSSAGKWQQEVTEVLEVAAGSGSGSGSSAIKWQQEAAVGSGKQCWEGAAASGSGSGKWHSAGKWQQEVAAVPGSGSGKQQQEVAAGSGSSAIKWQREAAAGSSGSTRKWQWEVAVGSGSSTGSGSRKQQQEVAAVLGSGSSAGKWQREVAAGSSSSAGKWQWEVAAAGKGGNVVTLPARSRSRQCRAGRWGPAGSGGAVALLCFLLPGGVLGPCRVSISPEEPTVEFGSALLLNCTSSCRNYSRLNWEVPVPKLGSSGPGWVSLSIPNVTEWTLELQCFGNFGEQRSIAKTTLRVYRLWPPQIDLEEGDLVAGKEARVTCNASARGVPPRPPKCHPDFGGGRGPPQHPPRSLGGSSFTVQPEQDGAEVTCRVTLRLRHRTVGTSTTARLRVCTAPHDVQAWAPRDVFTAGGERDGAVPGTGDPPPGGLLGAAHQRQPAALPPRGHRHRPGRPPGARGHLPVPGTEPLRRRRGHRPPALPRIPPQPPDPTGGDLGRGHHSGSPGDLLVVPALPELEADAGGIPARLIPVDPGSQQRFSDMFLCFFPLFPGARAVPGRKGGAAAPGIAPGSLYQTENPRARRGTTGHDGGTALSWHSRG
ncbi:uncharacterized protein LOC129734806 [Falco cherrug]|uniref:uncharacterized protein LOC129734806 n=1 Tax=Falco cherrug TaxID=345164 RepID=UPI002478B5ED|nr:uncharacterized protein LOC129734806 [Falco cherrug]